VKKEMRIPLSEHYCLLDKEVWADTAPPDSPGVTIKLRKNIEPWLSALLQTENNYGGHVYLFTCKAGTATGSPTLPARGAGKEKRLAWPPQAHPA
jgi:hypothetical protein